MFLVAMLLTLNMAYDINTLGANLNQIVTFFEVTDWRAIFLDWLYFGLEVYVIGSVIFVLINPMEF